MSSIAWKKLAIAGVAGLACGKGFAWMKQYPDTVRPIVYCSALSGTAGVLLGFGVAAYRDQPSHIYALSTGANFAVVTAVFLGIRHGILKLMVSEENVSTHSTTLTPSTTLTMEQTEFVSSAASGGVSLSLATILSRSGLRSTLLSGCVGVGLGVLSQLLYYQFERWRKRKAIEIHYPELMEERPGSVKNFEARFMDFWHQRSRATQADTDVMLLSEAIKEEKKKIKHLDEMLREKGVEPVASDNTDTEDKRTNDSVTSSEIQLPHTR